VREVNEAPGRRLRQSLTFRPSPQAARLSRLRDPRPSSSENQQSELDHENDLKRAITPRLPGAQHGSVDRPCLETYRKSGGAEARRSGVCGSHPIAFAAGEASCRLGSPYGVAQIGPSVECKRFEGECRVGLPRASLVGGRAAVAALPPPFRSDDGRVRRDVT
jgi:hypothetical protein